MRFSLVVATKNRTSEIEALFSSLRQQHPGFEVIVVDQNQDDRLGAIVKRAEAWFPVRRVRVTGVGLSGAKNVGLAHCQGEIVSFPDDDCLYPPGVLARADQRFAEEPDLAVLTGPAITEAGALSSGRWHTTSGPITRHSVWTSVIEFNLFAKRSLIQAVQGYDEKLGMGTRHGSCEGPDLVLRIMGLGGEAAYDLGLRVVHPNKGRTREAALRAGGYGRGMGYALRKNRAAGRTILTFLVRPLGGLGLSLTRADPVGLRYYGATFLGRVSGLLSKQSSSS